MLGLKTTKTTAVLIAAAVILGAFTEAEAGGVFDRVRSKKLLRCGVPITAAQLAVSALYVGGLFLLLGRP